MPAHRSLGTLFVLYLLIASYSARVAAQDANCHISLDGLTYDISHLSSVHTVERERNTPPTKMTDTLEFGICTELPVKGDAAAGDQCPAGTAACLTKVNKKESESTPERIVAVIQLAQASQTPDFATLSEPKGIRITRTGSKWPSDDGEQQSLVLDLLCTPGEQHSPEFVSYDGKTAKVQWRHEAACAMKGEPGGDGGGDGGNADGGESVGSGLGWFFLVLVLAFIGYFGLGAYYNYTTYGATGFDLIPHRDFWREVPYMLQDVVSHLCSSFRPRHSSSRGGYIAV